MLNIGQNTYLCIILTIEFIACIKFYYIRLLSVPLHKCQLFRIFTSEIPDSHRNIFIFKTQALFDDLSGKLISNIFSGVKIDFRFHKKSEQLAFMPL